MIEIAKYANVDDHTFVVKLGMTADLFIDKWNSDGALICVDYSMGSQDEIMNNRMNIVDVASRIATQMKYGK